MKERNGPVLLLWLVGAVFSIALLSSTALGGMAVRRLDRVEEKIEAIQEQYRKIDLILYRIDRIEKNLADLKAP